MSAEKTGAQAVYRPDGGIIQCPGEIRLTVLYQLLADTILQLRGRFPGEAHGHQARKRDSLLQHEIWVAFHEKFGLAATRTRCNEYFRLVAEGGLLLLSSQIHGCSPPGQTPTRLSCCDTADPSHRNVGTHRGAQQLFFRPSCHQQPSWPPPTPVLSPPPLHLRLYP